MLLPWTPPRLTPSTTPARNPSEAKTTTPKAAIMMLAPQT
jgi:hypothetical protein